MRKPLLLLFAPVVLALVACGGKSDETSGNPLVDAANATADAGSESTATTGKVSLPQQTLVLNGDGGYDHATDEGWQHLVITVPNAGKPILDEVFIKKVLWMKSSIFDRSLPKGKQWVKFDSNEAGRNIGFNFKSLMGQTPADVLEQLARTKAVKAVGTDRIDGVETTHYRAAIDPKKIPAADKMQKLSAARYKPVDVWVDEDGLIRQVKFDYTSKINPAQPPRARILLTMKLSDYGATVDVEPPETKLVVDATAPVPG